MFGLTALLDLPNFKPERADAVRAALHSYELGMDFADALYLASSEDRQKFMTFDKTIARRARKLGLKPDVALA